MVDPNNRQLWPPIHRSWLRLRLGKLYYGGRRRLEVYKRQALSGFTGCKGRAAGPASQM